MNILLHGNLQGISSFAIVNRHLIRGLERRGHVVTGFASDGAERTHPNPSPPDAYLVHGHPWDAHAAPGRVNIFALNYEYPTANQALLALVARLNTAFDRVVVPAPFLRLVLAAAGLRLPVTCVPWGFDPREFRPGVAPVPLPGPERFVFLHAAAANERKGTDAVIDAYQAEFAPDEAVRLVVKEAPRHPTWAQWADRVERQATRAGGPDVL